MCGIVAAITAKEKLTLDLRKYMYQGLIVDSLRGEDSTGIFSVFKSDTEFYKKAVAGPEFVQLKRAAAIIDGDAWALVGHNRAATRGKVSNENAHPFYHKHITLVHNGTITNAYDLAGKYHDVDSEAICVGIAEGKKPLDEFIGSIKGAYALVWHDANNDSMYITRNEERPLVYGLTDGGDVLLASEAGMLYWLAHRNSIKLIKAELIAKDVIYRIYQKEGALAHEEIPVKKPQSYTSQTTRAGNGTAAQADTNHTKSASQGKSTTQAGNGNITYTPQAVQMMEDFGIKSTERVKFLNWEKYGPNGFMGSLIGHLERDPFYEVQVGGVEFNSIKDFIGGIYDIKVRNVYPASDSSPYSKEGEPIIVTSIGLISKPKPVLHLVQQKKEVPKSEERLRSLYFDEKDEPCSYKKWKRLLHSAEGRCYNCGNDINRKSVKQGRVVFTEIQKEIIGAFCPVCVKKFSEEIAH